MGKKVVLDTNVLISAVGWEGNSRDVFLRILNKEFEMVISHKQLDELKRVMDYPKFTFSQLQKERFLAIILEIAVLVKTTGNMKVIKEDPDDDIILESAIVGNADFIITGDEHLLKLKEYVTVKIVTPKEFLDVISEESS